VTQAATATCMQNGTKKHTHCAVYSQGAAHYIACMPCDLCFSGTVHNCLRMIQMLAVQARLLAAWPWLLSCSAVEPQTIMRCHGQR
jgi:hypothetical protein